jgi:peptidyl-prolyl cis-trans isomerase A (cyclophilin A)
MRVVARLACAALAFLAAALPGDASATNPFVRMTTVLGSFDIELCAEASATCTGDAPASVANFLRYVDEDRYPPGTFIELVVKGQASWFEGGFFHAGQEPDGEFYFDVIEAFEPVTLEVGRGLSNLRGTVAVARAPLAPNSGTSSWFFNLSDNVGFDTVSGGYAVFGKVVRGMDVVDAIGEVPTYPCASPPLIDYPGCGATPAEDPPAVPYLVYVTSIERVPEPGIAGIGTASALALAWLRRRREAASRGRSHYLPRP